MTKKDWAFIAVTAIVPGGFILLLAASVRHLSKNNNMKTKIKHFFQKKHIAR